MQKFRIGAITDEFSPDLEASLRSMREIGMENAELRMVFGKNIIDLSDDDVKRAGKLVDDYGMNVVSIASPLLKCTLPDAPAVDERFQQDMFAAKHTYEDQPRLTERAFDIAEMLGAKIIRVFSYWRVVEPDQVFGRVVEALGALAEKAAAHGVIIGLENEHACNIATAAESARALAAVKAQNLKLVWDPAMLISRARFLIQRATDYCRWTALATCTRRIANWTGISRYGGRWGNRISIGGGRSRRWRGMDTTGISTWRRTGAGRAAISIRRA